MQLGPEPEGQRGDDPSQPLAQNKKAQKNLGQDFLQIHHDERDQDHGLGGFGQLRHDPAQGEASFALSKLAFDRNTIQLILFLLTSDFFLLSFIGFGDFLRSAQRRARQANPVLPAVTTIDTRAVDAVDVYGLQLEAWMYRQADPNL